MTAIKLQKQKSTLELCLQTTGDTKKAENLVPNGQGGTHFVTKKHNKPNLYRNFITYSPDGCQDPDDT